MSDNHVYTGDEGKEELQIVRSLIQDPDMTPEATVDQITKLTLAPKTYSRQLGDHCYHTARALLEVAAETKPEQQTKLIDFLHKLRKTTTIDPTTNKPFVHENKIVWTGLPTFGYTFADELNSIPSSDAADSQKGWENTISFFAQLDASTRDPDLDFTQTWATAYISSLGESSLAVRLASIWYIYDSDKIWSKVSTDGDLTPQKWRQWKKGLEDALQVARNDGTKEMISKALEEIKRVES